MLHRRHNLPQKANMHNTYYGICYAVNVMQKKIRLEEKGWAKSDTRTFVYLSFLDYFGYKRHKQNGFTKRLF
jgi:hypothetical protein